MMVFISTDWSCCFWSTWLDHDDSDQLIDHVVSDQLIDQSVSDQSTSLLDVLQRCRMEDYASAMVTST